MEASLVLGTTLAHSLSASRSFSISATERSSRSLSVSAWECERMAPIRMHRPSMMMCSSPEVPRILLVSTPAFHSSLDWPLPRSASIQGISEPASGTPNCEASMSVRWWARTLRSMSRMADAGSSSSELTWALSVPNWFSSSRICRAPPPEAAW